MSLWNGFVRVVVSCVVFLLFCALAEAQIQSRILQPEAVAAVDRMAQAAGAEVETTVSRQGVVSFLRTEPGAPILLATDGSAEERARSFLAEYGGAFGLTRGVEATVTRVLDVDEVGMEQVRFRQSFHGIPVTGGEIAVQLRGRSVVAVHAKTLPGLDQVEVDPVVTPAEALALVRELLADQLGVTEADLSEPRLELLNRGLLGDGGSVTRLAWFVEARGVALREYVWIDARIGRPLLRFSQLTDARNRRTYDANDPGDGVFNALPGVLVRSENGGPVGGAAGPDANAAHDHAGDTYEYFAVEHGRDSYDGAGAALVSTVRFCPSSGACPYDNAFWNGVQMVYGAGYSVADDVVAHELTHAVTEHTANLYYYMQSGALNESFSDIFGEAVDLTNGRGNDTAGVRWDLGEDLPNGAIRSLSNPNAHGDPGKSSDPQFVCGDSYAQDWGGVHSNSGVPNHAFALMVDGGTYNGKTISRLGVAKAAKIQYRVLSRYLLSASDFRDAADALQQACQDLIGTIGITAGNCSQVTKAVQAVEMDQTWPCAPSQATPPAYCEAGKAPVLWYHEDFEDGAGLAACPSGTTSTGFCLNQPSSLLGAFATSGTRSAWGYDKGSTDAITLQLVFPSMPPAGSRFRFEHAYGFENVGSVGYDGGQIHYTTNGGSTWVDAGSRIIGGQTYNGTLPSQSTNPLAGQAAFIRDSWGYAATQVSLSSLTGSAFGFRWVLGTDSIFDDLGWFLDDLRIYTCRTCVTNRTLDRGYNGTASEYRATNTITALDGFTVAPGETVVLAAGNRVVLGPGFVAGGSLTVRTGDSCP